MTFSGQPSLRVTVHAAVQQHGRQTVAVRLENPVDDLQILHAGTALVVNDHIIILRPIRLLVDRVQVLNTGVGIVGDGPHDIRTGGNPFGQNILLLRVVVAAAAEDQQRANRLAGIFGACGAAGEAQDRNTKHGDHRRGTSMQVMQSHHGFSR